MPADDAAPTMLLFLLLLLLLLIIIIIILSVQARHAFLDEDLWFREQPRLL